MEIGHIGHLVQIPRAEADAAASFAPDYWTVFNDEKASEAAAAAKKRGRSQALLARIQAKGDRYYRGHEGGFDAGEVVAVADRIDATGRRRLRRHHDVSGAALRSGDAARSRRRRTLRRSTAPPKRCAQAGAAEDRDQRAGHHFFRRARCAGGGRRHAGRARPRPDRHDAAPRGRGPARTPRRGLCQRGVPFPRHGDAYCFGGGLYIDPSSPTTR